jgi:hypothetical protein
VVSSLKSDEIVHHDHLGVYGLITIKINPVVRSR